MDQDRIDKLEQQREQKKTLFIELLTEFLDSVERDKDLQQKFNVIYTSKVNYVNAFQKLVNAYDVIRYEENENLRNSVVDDAISLSEMLIEFWTTVLQLNKKHQIQIPPIGQNDYHTTQKLINTYNPETAKKLSKQFQNLHLPVSGFNKKLTIMTSKLQVKVSAISGAFFLVLILFLALYKECPSEFQAIAFRVVLALGAGAFASIIVGTISFNNKIITAGGPIAIAVLMYLFNPAPLTEYKRCIEQISGTVYYGNKGENNVEVILSNHGKTTETNMFGKFQFEIDQSNLDATERIEISSNEIHLDTIVLVKNEDLSKEIEIYITKHCIDCRAIDSTGVYLGSKSACSSSLKYINDYEAGSFRKALEEKTELTCTRSEL